VFHQLTKEQIVEMVDLLVSRVEKALAVKDMGIVTSAARSAGLAVPVASAAEQLYLLGQAQGKQALDDSAIITVIAPEPHHGKQ